MLRRIEALLDPTGPEPEAPPTAGLLRFYWHFIRQARWVAFALFVVGGLTAILDTTIPTFIGRIVGLVSTHSPDVLWRDCWRELLGMALVVGLARPVGHLANTLLVNQVVNPSFTNLIRWQNHWHVVRQSWSFFQNDFAGRVANRVMQTGPSMRDSLVMAFDAAWYIIVYGGSALFLLGSLNWRLMLPMTAWFVCYIVLLTYFVPRLRERSRAMSEKRSTLIGRVVDSYTNILTVKLFARARDEDKFVKDAVDEHTAASLDQARMTTGYTVTLNFMNAALILGTSTIAIWQWTAGHIAVGGVATAIPMSWQLTNIAGWVARSITGIFENIGTVQDGMRSIDVPRLMPDPPGARERPLRLWPGSPPGRGAARDRSDHRVRGAGGACRSIGRGQVDSGQSAAAFFRAGPGTHPDRRSGYRRRHAGKPAQADCHGHSGYVVAAPFHQRKYPLRPAGRDRRDDRGSFAAGRGA
jgi:ATP-binding cassette subfamily B multidrug efflux pump